MAVLSRRHGCDDLTVALVMVVVARRARSAAATLEVALQPLHPPLLVLQGGAQVGGAVGELDGVQEVGGGRRGPLLRVLRAGWGATERAEGCHWQIGRAEMNFIRRFFERKQFSHYLDLLETLGMPRPATLV